MKVKHFFIIFVKEFTMRFSFKLLPITRLCVSFFTYLIFSTQEHFLWLITLLFCFVLMSCFIKFLFIFLELIFFFLFIFVFLQVSFFLLFFLFFYLRSLSKPLNVIKFKFFNDNCIPIGHTFN